MDDYGTEAEAMQDMDDCVEIEYNADQIKEFRDNRIERLKEVYEQNKIIPIGRSISCPVCGRKFVKKTKGHSFCSNKIKGKSNCKDKFWNTVDVRKYLWIKGN